MATDEARLRQKAIDAFKGVVRTHKLDPSPPRELGKHPDYVPTLKMFHDQDGKNFELVYERDALDRFLNCVERLYPEQVDRKQVRRQLQESMIDWIEQGHDREDTIQAEQVAGDLFDRVEQEIKSLLVYVPIEGLTGSYPDGLQLGRCQLYRNSRQSELRKLLEADKKRLPTFDDYSEVEKAPAFLRVSLTAHANKARQQALEETRLALNVLCLFIGSYFFDTYKDEKMPRCMGALGTLPMRTHEVVFDASAHIPIDEQYPGSSMSLRHHRSFELKSGADRLLIDNGLERINQLICEIVPSSKGSLSIRLLRAINWFGQATTADGIAESYLLYAIAAESLLSEGRTGKETYGIRMAALVTREKDLYPIYGQYISPRFAKEFQKHPDQHFQVTKKRVVDLFDVRNGIAHGRLLDYEIEPSDLLDLESLVRCSILSFVLGGWASLDEYKDWLKREHPP
jgi:hypothetical protein